MDWLTHEEKRRAWGRLRRRHGNEIQASAQLVHMVSQWERQLSEAERFGLDWLAKITRMALHFVRRRTFITHAEVDVFLKRHITAHKANEKAKGL